MTTTASKIVYSHITKDPEVCGGRACIDGTRIRVMDVVALQREGCSPEGAADVFSVPLSLAQVHAALAYYYDHREELDASFAEQDRAEEETEQRRIRHLAGHRSP